jgi:hypothetical protein
LIRRRSAGGTRSWPDASRAVEELRLHVALDPPPLGRRDAVLARRLARRLLLEGDVGVEKPGRHLAVVDPQGEGRERAAHDLRVIEVAVEEVVGRDPPAHAPLVAPAEAGELELLELVADGLVLGLRVLPADPIRPERQCAATDEHTLTSHALMSGPAKCRAANETG